MSLLNLLSVMRFPALISRRLLVIALVAIAAGSPYAIPVPWLAISQWATGSIVENPDVLSAPVDNQSWFVVFAAICASWAALFSYWGNFGPHDKMDATQRLLLLSGATWFTVTLVRATAAPQFQSMGRELLLQIAFLILFMIAALHRAKTPDLAVFQKTLTIAGIPLTVIALMQNSGADPLAYSAVVPGTLDVIGGKQLIASTFGHPNYMGSYLAPTIVIATGLAMSRISVLWRVLGAVSAVLSVLALVAGGTRGPLLAVIAGLLVMFAMQKRTGKNKWSSRRMWTSAAAVIAISALLALVAKIFPALRPSFDLTDRLFAGQEIASRIFYWMVGLEMFYTSPLFGIGAGQFDSQFWWALSHMPEIEPDGPWHFMVQFIVRGVRPGYLHNDHLQVLVETGLAGVLAWIGLWAAIATGSCRFRCRSTWEQRDYMLNAAFVGAFAAVAVDAGFGFPFHLPCSGALYWIALGLWCGWQTNKSDQQLQVPLRKAPALEPA